MKLRWQTIRHDVVTAMIQVAGRQADRLLLCVRESERASEQTEGKGGTG